MGGIVTTNVQTTFGTAHADAFVVGTESETLLKIAFNLMQITKYVCRIYGFSNVKELFILLEKYEIFSRCTAAASVRCLHSQHTKQRLPLMHTHKIDYDVN